MKRFVQLQLLPLMLVAGCSSYSVPQIVSPNGVVTRIEGTPVASASLTENFQYYAQEAAAAPEDPTKGAAMLGSGFVLVKADCDQFFTRMGKRQRTEQVMRDTIAPVVTVLTGVISLVHFKTDGSQQRYLQALALGAGLSNSALDVYDEHFLFGADNIYEVRELTFKALDAHRQGVYAEGTFHFDDAVMHLIDHQAICTPSGILSLTKRAIAAGKVTPESNPTSDGQDGDALLRLGTMAGLPGLASADQAGALWWLLHGAPADKYAAIGPSLSGWGDKSPLVQNPSTKAWSYRWSSAQRDAALAILDDLTASTKAGFEKKIKEMEAEKGVVPTGDQTPFSLSTPSSRVGLQVD